MDIKNKDEVILKLLEIAENILDDEGLAHIRSENQKDWYDICEEYNFDSVYRRLFRKSPRKIGKI